MTSASPAPQHLTPEVLAAYLERRLDSGAREEADLHLARCEQCRRDLSAAGRLVRRYRRRGLPLAMVAAAASVALLVLVVRGTPPQPDRYRSSAPSAGAELAAPGLVTPRAGDTIAGGEPLTFRWRPGSEGSLHRVVLADEAGRTIWLADAAAPAVALPAEIVLQPGATYLWYVEAVGADGERISSTPAAFTVR